jgi:hypothetical protein
LLVTHSFIWAINRGSCFHQQNHGKASSFPHQLEHILSYGYPTYVFIAPMSILDMSCLRGKNGQPTRQKSSCWLLYAPGKQGPCGWF